MEIVLAILKISIIDLVLSGDNAAVIGLAIKDLPDKQRKKAAFWGAGGAIVLRIIFTVLATILIRIPYLNLIGGVILLWITWKLLAPEVESDECHPHKAIGSFWNAIWIIIIADLSMAFDNIMGVAGAAEGETWLVIFGLALSIPILIFGATWLAGMMNRFPIIIYLGGAVLIHTSLIMILHDKGFNLAHYAGGELGAQLIAWGSGLLLLLIGVVKTRKARHHNHSAKQACK